MLDVDARRLTIILITGLFALLVVFQVSTYLGRAAQRNATYEGCLRSASDRWDDYVNLSADIALLHDEDVVLSGDRHALIQVAIDAKHAQQAHLFARTAALPQNRRRFCDGAFPRVRFLG